jgi:hypothetical protein
MKAVNQPDIEQQLNIGIHGEESIERTIRAKYLMVFKDGIGQEVLRDILLICGFMGQLNPDDKAMVGRYNAGLEIAEKAGVLKAIASHILGLKV